MFFYAVTVSKLKPVSGLVLVCSPTHAIFVCATTYFQLLYEYMLPLLSQRVRTPTHGATLPQPGPKFCMMCHPLYIGERSAHALA